jgi:hypothetical protein
MSQAAGDLAMCWFLKPQALDRRSLAVAAPEAP